MATQADNDGPSPPTPNPPTRFVLQPGQLSKPEKVWASSSALIIGFYQAAPYSEAFKIFYKKSGAVFGTQVMLTPASILGPELAVRQPMLGEAQYFEYEIKKLKPSTQYVVKIKTSDDSSEVRLDKLVTISREEERTRDNDMCNFKGALVKLGDYDGLVVSYTQSSGIFGIRILQIDDVASSLQLARLTSDYTDSGVPVQAYTLSQVRFGRWGGAITCSKVVNEGELKWLVARAVQMGDKSDAAAMFEERQRKLQAQVERVTLTLEVEWSNRFRSLRIRSLTSLALLVLLAVAAVAGMWAMLGAAGRRQRDLEGRLAAGTVRQAELEAELQILHLYRVSLELDVERRMALSDPGSNPVSAGSGLSHVHGSDDEAGSGNSSSAGGCGSVHGDVYRIGLLRNNATAAGDGKGEDGGGGIGGGGGGGRRAATGHKGRGGGGGGGGSGHRAHGPEPGRSREGSSKAARLPAVAPHKDGASSSSSRSRGRSSSRKGTAGGGGSGGSNSRRAGPLDDWTRRPGRAGSSGGGGGGGSRHHRRSGEEPEEAGGGGGGGGGGAANLWGLPHQALRAALERSRLGRQSAEGRHGGDWAPEWLAAAGGMRLGHDPEDDPDEQQQQQQPDAWTFIHYVSNVYALHLQEWMKVQLQKSVRRRVNEMLTPGRTDGDGGGGDGGSHDHAGDGEEDHDRDGGGGGAAGDGEEDQHGHAGREYEYDEEYGSYYES
ncbi:hypothetical protein PLESTB_000890700 [Pleodorina starrii]|uniref:Uncharacterized protein n=1 Tax=Pleodorina starrii TaxID=330485 RepID=A0A9W6F339_9CHLO|nr:hypothetical protein PLESTB_000890700 [Pleodorina starrii]